MHFRATFFTLNDRAVITFNAEFALFDLVTVAGWVITTDMQLTFRIDEIAVHRRAAFRATTFCAQRVGFSVFAFQYVQHFVFRHQVNGGFATLFRRQRITRTAKEYPGARCANPHFATTSRAVNAGQNHLVRAHTTLFRIFFSFI
ncbi:Uncharacterised protein [Shigella sonnei]|nr:Uncharacterised protein [Shigella sonnei]CSR86684.1 Uncharacterised protein [Shigella sonnei]